MWGIEGHRSKRARRIVTMHLLYQAKISGSNVLAVAPKLLENLGWTSPKTAKEIFASIMELGLNIGHNS
jgi:hypothetical protein